MTQGQVDVSRDATRLEMTIAPRQPDADLDVYLFGRNGLVAQATTRRPGSRDHRGPRPPARQHGDRGGGCRRPERGRRSSTTTSGPTRVGSAASPSTPAPGRRLDPGQTAHGQRRRSRRTPSRSAALLSSDASSSPSRRGAVVGTAEVAHQPGRDPGRGGAGQRSGDGRLRPEQRRRDDRRQADRLATPSRSAGPRTVGSSSCRSGITAAVDTPTTSTRTVTPSVRSSATDSSACRRCGGPMARWSSWASRTGCPTTTPGRSPSTTPARWSATPAC